MNTGMAVDWSEFLRASLEKPLHSLWKQIDPYLVPGGVAMDLGCGAGTGTLHLLDKGLKVVAIDHEPEAIEMLRARLPEGADVHVLRAQFQDVGLDPNSLDVAVAFFSIFFLRSWEFGQLWKRLEAALKPGAIFAGQLLGVGDDWAKLGYASQTREEVDNLLKGFEVLYLEEVDRDGETILREPKHWHIFHVVARKI